MITHVAIRFPVDPSRFNNAVILERGILFRDSFITYFLPKPFRHHHVIWMLANGSNTFSLPADNEQGFLTDKKEFLNREDAAEYAVKCGQLKETELKIPGTLFSEDLW